MMTLDMELRQRFWFKVDEKNQLTPTLTNLMNDTIQNSAEKIS